MDTKQLTFDYKIVDINEVVPNDWNPKKDDPEEYQKVVNSLINHGLKAPITVREFNGKFQIIDGFHRWKGCKELGYDKVIINNLGVISDIEAKEMTIVFQKISVPFDEVMYAQLLTSMVKDSSRDEILKKLPIQEEELDAYMKMADFNFDDLGKDVDIETELHDPKEITCPACGEVFKI